MKSGRGVLMKSSNHRARREEGAWVVRRGKPRKPGLGAFRVGAYPRIIEILAGSALIWHARCVGDRHASRTPPPPPAGLPRNVTPRRRHLAALRACARTAA